jgi:hypothetical protein
MLLIVEDRLMGDQQFRIHSERMTSIRISIVLREVAAGDFDSDAVALQEHITGRP